MFYCEGNKLAFSQIAGDGFTVLVMGDPERYSTQMVSVLAAHAMLSGVIDTTLWADMSETEKQKEEKPN